MTHAPHRSAKLFRNGGSQAVRIPREFRFETEDVVISREGDGVLIRPARTRVQAMLAWLREQEPLGPEDRLPPIERRPAQPVTIFEDWVDEPADETGTR